MKKNYIVIFIILILIIVSAIGMHQTHMVRNVSKILFEGGHTHNWYWADGWLTEALMAIRPAIPVILCTGYSKKIAEESALEIGIRAFDYKPIVKSDLAKIVRNVLDEARP